MKIFPRLTPWILATGLISVVLPSGLAQEPVVMPTDWEALAALEGSTPRSYLSDGTLPAVSKGRGSQSAVQPAGFESVRSGSVLLELPRMPHGFLDPTHPAGPAEPGSATPLHSKPRFGPVSAGFVIAKRRW